MEFFHAASFLKKHVVELQKKNQQKALPSESGHNIYQNRHPKVQDQMETARRFRQAAIANC